MGWTANLLRRKSKYIYFFIFVLLIFGFHSRYKKVLNTSENNNAFVDSIRDSQVNQIHFSKSELIEETNSKPSSGVLMERLDGYGLGNHLFLYAESYALSRNLKLPLLLPLPPENLVHNSKNFSDRGFVLDNFSLPKGIFLDQIGVSKRIYTATCEMVKNISLISKTILEHTKYFRIRALCFDGEFFEKYEKELQQIKVKVKSPSEGYVKWKELIMNTEWPIAVHVRRGDIENQYWSAPVKYFYDALQRMKKEAPRNLRKQVFFFSDDIEWVKDNLDRKGNFRKMLGWPIHFVSGSFGGLTNLEELDLMIRCKSIVISNSTFSWWAAYLMNNTGDKKKVVIRPKFNAIKHQNDPAGLNGATRYDYAISYPSEWIAIVT